MSPPRLFVGNFDFEHRLADPLRVLPRRIEELNADLAWSWLALARDGDMLWTPRPPGRRFAMLPIGAT